MSRMGACGWVGGELGGGGGGGYVHLRSLQSIREAGQSPGPQNTAD